MIEVQDRFVTFIPPQDAKYLMGDFTDWDEKPLAISQPIVLEFPPGAYVEYAFLDFNQQPLTDLANPERPKNPWYDYHRAITLPNNRFQTPLRPKCFSRKYIEICHRVKFFYSAANLLCIRTTSFSIGDDLCA